MPWWAFAWRFRDDFKDAPVPGNWWKNSLGSILWWADKILERLPGSALFDPLPPIVCDCDECRETALEEPVL
jgi:hypothetical protein